MTGPSALGEEAQSGIHQILGAPQPLGWDSQLHDEFAFAVSFDRRWRPPWAQLSTDIGGLEFDLTPSAGVTLGTLRTEARVGAAVASAGGWITITGRRACAPRSPASSIFPAGHSRGKFSLASKAVR
ncbi:MAG: DUF2219 family protein [Caulobacteraceae bacterium]|nr:DUF2219 family protein [Caulobacteraceae bacterium]